MSPPRGCFPLWRRIGEASSGTSRVDMRGITSDLCAKVISDSITTFARFTVGFCQYYLDDKADRGTQSVLLSCSSKVVGKLVPIERLWWTDATSHRTSGQSFSA